MPLDREPGFVAIARRYLQDLPGAARSALTALRLAAASRDSADHGRTAALLQTLNPDAWAALDGFVMPEPPALPEGWEASWEPR